jgi:hypothetical protein
MKRITLLAASLSGFIFIAAPTAVEYHQFLLNGKPFANAATINGVLAIPLRDFVRAAGGNTTLEPYFQLQGSTLTTKTTSDGVKAGKVVDKSSPKLTSERASSDIFAKLGDIKGEAASAQRLFRIQKIGVISTNVMMHNGQAYVPLADVVKAFGVANWNGGAVAPGQSLSLNFTSNANAMLGN